MTIKHQLCTRSFENFISNANFYNPFSSTHFDLSEFSLSTIFFLLLFVIYKVIKFRNKFNNFSPPLHVLVNPTPYSKIYYFRRSFVKFAVGNNFISSLSKVYLKLLRPFVSLTQVQYLSKVIKIFPQSSFPKLPNPV